MIEARLVRVETDVTGTHVVGEWDALCTQKGTHTHTQTNKQTNTHTHRKTQSNTRYKNAQGCLFHSDTLHPPIQQPILP